MWRCGDAALQTVKLFGEVCGGVALPIATVARSTTGKAIPNRRRPRLLTKVVEYQSLTLISSSFGLNNVSARYHQNLLSLELDSWGDSPPRLRADSCQGTEAMEAVGMPRSCDRIRRPMRTTHGADFASCYLIQILDPDFASRSGRSRIFPGDGHRCFEPSSNTSRAVSTGSFAAAPTGDPGTIPKRYEE
jgi:hypothetical protein